MIQKREYNWKECKFETSSVMSVHPAFDQSFVIVIGSFHLLHNLIHVDRTGGILRWQALRQNTSMTMISNHEVIVGEPTRLWLMDLKDKEKDKYISMTGINLHCSCHRPPQLTGQRPTSESFFFPETQLLCLVHHCVKDQSDNLIHVIFFPKSSIDSGTKQSICGTKVHGNKWTKVLKVDNYSSIATFGPIASVSSKNVIIIISKDQKRYFLDTQKSLGSIQNIWRRNEDEFYIKQNEMKSGFFIVNIPKSQLDYKRIVSEYKVIFQISFFDKYFIIKCRNYNWSLDIYNYDLQLFKNVILGPHFVFCPCPYDGMMMTSYWATKSSRSISMKSIKFFAIQDAYMQMLLHLNEDFDDDILLDAMNVLGFE